MDFVHCNQCFQRNPKEGYSLSSCFHIFCQKCAKKDLSTCPLCNKKIRLVVLDGNISSGIKSYFADPIKTITEHMTKLHRKFEFQDKMRVSLIKHLMKEKEKKRQMEAYFRKKGQEFESQKKKLAEATVWIQNAERRLQASEEEKLRAQSEMESLRVKLKSLSTTSTQPVHHKTPNQYTFLPPESQEPAMAASMIDSSPNSTFNMVSPLVNSPALSNNSSNLNAFFDNGQTVSTGTEPFNDDLMFNTISSGQSAQANISNSSAFSTAFNNMFTPTRNLNATSVSANQTAINQTALDKTSISLDNWRKNKSNSFGSHNISKRETSLPLRNGVPSSVILHQSHQKSRVAPPSSQHRRSVVGMDRQQVQDMRRISSQPGYLAQRKPINNRSTFLEQND